MSVTEQELVEALNAAVNNSTIFMTRVLYAAVERGGKPDLDEETWRKRHNLAFDTLARWHDEHHQDDFGRPR